MSKTLDTKIDNLQEVEFNREDKLRTITNLTDLRAFADSEHDLKFWDAVRRHPTAVCWAMFICIAIIMAGFDAQIITSFYALPAFQRKYGRHLSNGDYEISAPWQTALGMGNPVGQALGALLCSWPLERFGRKKTLAVCCVWSIAFVFVQFFSNSIGMLCAGEFLGGQAFGFYVVLAPTYASEICPLALRGVLTASCNLAFVIGQFIAQGCAAGVEKRMDDWAYKAPFAVQWIWPLVLLVGLPFCPESPWWLIRQGRKNDARKALVKLSANDNQQDLDSVIDMMHRTDILEQELEAAASYMDCFKGTNLIRTEISVMVYLIQIIGGCPLIGYSNFFFEQAGLNPSDALNMGVGNTALGFVGSCLSWPLLHQFGRRTLYNGGMVITTTLLFIIAFLDFGKTNKGVDWAQASLMDVWTFFWQMTIGPIAYVIFSEISSTRLRSRTIAIGTVVQACASIVITVAMPYMLNTDEANWRGKTGFLFGGSSLVCCAWCFWRLPESRGRTFEELDILFERKVEPRKFRTYEILESSDGGGV